MNYDLLPKTCFSCPTELKREYYIKYEVVCNESHDVILKVLDEMGLKRACCRRMILSYDPEYYKILSLYDENTLNDAPKL